MKPYKEQTYYELLEIDTASTMEEVRAAYERAMLLYDSDSVALYPLGDPAQVDDLKKLLLEAMEILTDEDLRVEYDRSLGLPVRERHPPSESPVTSATPQGANKQVPAEVAQVDARAAEARQQADQRAQARAREEAAREQLAERAREEDDDAHIDQRRLPKLDPIPPEERPEVDAEPSPEASDADAPAQLVMVEVVARAETVHSTAPRYSVSYIPHAPPASREPVEGAVEASQPADPLPPDDAAGPATSRQPQTPSLPSGPRTMQRMPAASAPALTAEPRTPHAPSAPALTADARTPHGMPAAPAPALTAEARTPHGMPAASARVLSSEPHKISTAPDALAPSISTEPPTPVEAPALSLEPPTPLAPRLPAANQQSHLPEEPTPPPEPPSRVTALEPTLPPPGAPAPASRIAPGAAMPMAPPPPRSTPIMGMPVPAQVASEAQVGASGEPSTRVQARSLGQAPVMSQESAIAAAESAMAQVSAHLASRPREGRPKPREIPPDAVFNGELFRQIRQSRGQSLQQLADKTRISARHLENIEADHYGALPTTVYLRGFLMSLARELGIDPIRASKGYLALVEQHARSRGK